jgi:predicted cation transporter
MMTTGNLHLDLIIGGLMGLLFHVFALKLPAMKTRAENANMGFSLSGYLKDDWVSLCASIASVVIAAFVIDEILQLQPAIKGYLKFFFVFIGYTGSSVLQGILSRTEKKIQQVVDEKTNKADGNN